MTLNRKNALFAGHDRGAAHWGIVASLIETCKLNGVDPAAYLANVLSRLVNGWPMRHIDELLPWADAVVKTHGPAVQKIENALQGDSVDASTNPQHAAILKLDLDAAIGWALDFLSWCRTRLSTARRLERQPWLAASPFAGGAKETGRNAGPAAFAFASSRATRRSETEGLA